MSRLATPQVYTVVLRDRDQNVDKPRLVHLMPIGDTLGIAITAFGETPKDSEIVFVEMEAFGIALPALGFTGSAGIGAYITAPKNAEP